mgnify:CR=1 FL=1
MTWTKPTIDQLKTEISGVLRGLRSTIALGPGSDGAILRDTLAHLASGLHMHLQYGVLHNLIPTRASYPYIDWWAYLFGLSDGSGGYGRIKARGSSATDGMTVTATGATGDLLGEQFSDSAGNIYQINQSYTFGGAGSADLDVAAVSWPTDKGDATNVKISDQEVFAWVSTPAGCSDTLTQAADFSGGADREEDAALRARLQEKLQTPPQGGNWANWKTWIEAVSPGELRAYVWNKRQYSDTGYGYGCVDYCAFLARESGADRIIAAADEMYESISDAIEESAPILAMRNSRQLTITQTAMIIDVTLEMASNATEAQKCDWDAESVKAQVDASTVATRTITADASICAPTMTGGLEVGHRVIIAGAEAVVLAVNVGADAKVFTVETWPSAWGAVNDALVNYYILAGGGVILDAVEGLREMADAIGPAKGPYAAPIPGWDDELRLAKIKTAVIQSCDGAAVDMTINVPATDVAPGYDDDADVEAIVVTHIHVWEPK